MNTSRRSIVPIISTTTALALSLALTGCGGSAMELNQASGQQGPPIVAPVLSGYFVDAAVGDDALGDFATGRPFATVQAAVEAAGAGQTIVVRPGTYSGTVTLLEGQALLADGFENGASADVRPLFTGSIVLNDGNTVRGLELRSTPGGSIQADGRVNGTITDNLITGTGGGEVGIGGLDVVGDWIVEDNVVTGSTGAAIFFGTAEGETRASTFRLRRNVLSNADFNAVGFLFGGDNEVKVQMLDNVMMDNSPEATFIVIVFGDIDGCFDIEGNSNDATYSFADFSLAATLQVEQLEQFEELNSGTLVVEGETVLGDVPDGHCGF